MDPTPSQAVPHRASVLAVAVLLLFTTVPPGGGAIASPVPNLSAEEQAYLASHGPVRYVFNEGYAPFTLVDERGAVRGINVDMLRLISVRLGVEFEMVQVEGLAQRLQAISDGTADVTGNLAATAERAQSMDFTRPYVTVRTLLWVREGTSLPSDMAGARIAVVGNTTAIAAVETRWPLAELVYVGNVQPGLDAVRAGTVDALASADVPTVHTMQAERYFDIMVWGQPLDEQEFSFAVPRGQDVLLSILDKGLASISNEERAAIFVKWTGRDLGAPPMPVSEQTSGRMVALAIASTLALALALAIPLWIWTLKGRVARKTLEVQELNAELERKVAERTRQLQATNQELESLSYSVGHDLRAPLRALDGFSQDLLEQHADALPPDARDSLERIRSASQRMSSLVQGLLTLHKAGQGAIEFEEVDLSARALQISKDLSARDPSRHVDFLIRPGLRARANSILVEDALRNLLENAWKFTSKHARAKIEFGTEDTPRGSAFFVRDDGAGFDPQRAENLFGAFQRLHRASDFPGSGIGLASVRRIIARHGGATWATAAPEKGATFYFTLPQDGSGAPGPVPGKIPLATEARR